jgi:DNA polymerase III subunit chi
MTEIRFYHLQRQPLEAVLPKMLAMTLERGQRAVVQAASEERLAALDDHLWTFEDDSFLPHAVEGPGAAEQPVLLTLSEANPNGAQVRFLVEGAPLPGQAEAYARVIVIFDGNDDDALAAARAQWKAAKASGHEASYWQQGPGGWERKA